MDRSSGPLGVLLSSPAAALDVADCTLVHSKCSKCAHTPFLEKKARCGENSSPGLSVFFLSFLLGAAPSFFSFTNASVCAGSVCLPDASGKHTLPAHTDALVKEKNEGAAPSRKERKKTDNPGEEFSPQRAFFSKNGVCAHLEHLECTRVQSATSRAAAGELRSTPSGPDDRSIGLRAREP